MQTTNISFNVYDKEFRTYIKGAQLLVEKLSGEEKEIAICWMKRLVNLHTNDVTVKKDRNHFLKKLVEVMKQSVIQRVLNHPKSKELTLTQMEKIKEEILNIDERPATPKLDLFLLEGKESSNYMCMWSSDRRIYVAAKPIPGRGALVYMAVSERPELGWTIPNQEVDE